MKKIILRAAIFISVLLLIFQGILMYRDYVSYHNVIHEHADKIIKIRVDAIGKSMLYDALLHPVYYYNHLKQDKDSIDDEKPDKGYGFPANIFVYTIKDKKASTLFSSFKISNAENFKFYLIAEGFSGFENVDNFQTASKNDKKLNVAFNDKRCVVVYTPSKEEVRDIVADLLLEGKYLSKTQDLYKKLKHASADISYISGRDDISINFKDGKAEVSGNLELPSDVEVLKEIVLTEFSPESSLSFYLNINTSRHFDPIIIEAVTISPDSINRYYKGAMSLELAGKTPQQDSIVSYEYNDNFEKVEVKTAITKEVPEINLMVSAKSKELLNYLVKASIIKNGKLNYELFPLYQFKVDTTANKFQLSTNASKIIDSAQISYNDVFGLEIDFVKLKAQNQITILEEYFNAATNLKLNGKLHHGNSMTIDGQLKLKLADINGMAQLIF